MKKTLSTTTPQCCREVHEKYPDIVYDEMIVDNACMQLVKNPNQFDVLVRFFLFSFSTFFRPFFSLSNPLFFLSFLALSLSHTHTNNRFPPLSKTSTSHTK